MRAKPEIARHIRSTLLGLIKLADTTQSGMLSYLLKIAALEAERHAPDLPLLDAETTIPSAHPIGFWDWDLASNRIYADSRAADLFNLSQDEGRKGTLLDRWVEAVHPDDLHSLSLAISHAIDGACDYTTRFRVVTPDRLIRYVQVHGSCLAAADGRPSRILGCFEETAAPMHGNDDAIRLDERRKTH